MSSTRAQYDIEDKAVDEKISKLISDRKKLKTLSEEASSRLIDTHLIDKAIDQLDNHTTQLIQSQKQIYAATTDLPAKTKQLERLKNRITLSTINEKIADITERTTLQISIADELKKLDSQPQTELTDLIHSMKQLKMDPSKVEEHIATLIQAREAIEDVQASISKETEPKSKQSYIQIKTRLNDPLQTINDTPQLIAQFKKEIAVANQQNKDKFQKQITETKSLQEKLTTDLEQAKQEVKALNDKSSAKFLQQFEEKASLFFTNYNDSINELIKTVSDPDYLFDPKNDRQKLEKIKENLTNNITKLIYQAKTKELEALGNKFAQEQQKLNDITREAQSKKFDTKLLETTYAELTQFIKYTLVKDFTRTEDEINKAERNHQNPLYETKTQDLQHLKQQAEIKLLSIQQTVQKHEARTTLQIKIETHLEQISASIAKLETLSDDMKTVKADTTEIQNHIGLLKALETNLKNQQTIINDEKALQTVDAYTNESNTVNELAKISLDTPKIITESANRTNEADKNNRQALQDIIATINNNLIPQIGARIAEIDKQQQVLSQALTDAKLDQKEINSSIETLGFPQIKTQFTQLKTQLESYQKNLEDLTKSPNLLPANESDLKALPRYAQDLSELEKNSHAILESANEVSLMANKTADQIRLDVARSQITKELNDIVREYSRIQTSDGNSVYYSDDIPIHVATFQRYVNTPNGKDFTQNVLNKVDLLFQAIIKSKEMPLTQEIIVRLNNQLNDITQNYQTHGAKARTELSQMYQTLLQAAISSKTTLQNQVTTHLVQVHQQLSELKALQVDMQRLGMNTELATVKNCIIALEDSRTKFEITQQALNDEKHLQDANTYDDAAAKLTDSFKLVGERIPQLITEFASNVATANNNSESEFTKLKINSDLQQSFKAALTQLQDQIDATEAFYNTINDDPTLAPTLSQEPLQGIIFTLDDIYNNADMTIKDFKDKFDPTKKNNEELQTATVTLQKEFSSLQRATQVFTDAIGQTKVSRIERTVLEYNFTTALTNLSKQITLLNDYNSQVIAPELLKNPDTERTIQFIDKKVEQAQTDLDTYSKIIIKDASDKYLTEAIADLKQKTLDLARPRKMIERKFNETEDLIKKTIENVTKSDLFQSPDKKAELTAFQTKLNSDMAIVRNVLDTSKPDSFFTKDQLNTHLDLLQNLQNQLTSINQQVEARTQENLERIAQLTQRVNAAIAEFSPELKNPHSNVSIQEAINELNNLIPDLKQISDNIKNGTPKNYANEIFLLEDLTHQTIDILQNQTKLNRLKVSIEKLSTTLSHAENNLNAAEKNIADVDKTALNDTRNNFKTLSTQIQALLTKVNTANLLDTNTTLDALAKEITDLQKAAITLVKSTEDKIANLNNTASLQLLATEKNNFNELLTSYSQDIQTSIQNLTDLSKKMNNKGQQYVIDFTNECLNKQKTFTALHASVDKAETLAEIKIATETLKRQQDSLKAAHEQAFQALSKLAFSAKPSKSEETSDHLTLKTIDGIELDVTDEEALRAQIKATNAKVNELSHRLAVLRSRHLNNEIDDKEFNKQQAILEAEFNSLPKSNYRATHSSGIGLVELQGKRPSQEDRVKVGLAVGVTLADGNKLNDKQWNSALENTVNELQKNIAKLNHQDGACLCANVISGNKVYTANVGDSTSYVVIVKPDGSATTARLNNLHKPDQAGELARLANEKQLINVQGSRLGTLAVSRAINDPEAVTLGLSHKPELSKPALIQLNTGEQAFVITACDGLTERGLEARIGTIVSANKAKTNEEIALALANAAVDSGSTDNISVIVTNIDPNDKRAKYAAVFDGHGGANTAQALEEHFEDELNRQVTSKQRTFNFSFSKNKDQPTELADPIYIRSEEIEQAKHDLRDELAVVSSIIPEIYREIKKQRNSLDSIKNEDSIEKQLVELDALEENLAVKNDDRVQILEQIDQADTKEALAAIQQNIRLFKSNKADNKNPGVKEIAENLETIHKKTQESILNSVKGTDEITKLQASIKAKFDEVTRRVGDEKSEYWKQVPYSELETIRKNLNDQMLALKNKSLQKDAKPAELDALKQQVQNSLKRLDELNDTIAFEARKEFIRLSGLVKNAFSSTKLLFEQTRVSATDKPIPEESQKRIAALNEQFNEAEAELNSFIKSFEIGKVSLDDFKKETDRHLRDGAYSCENISKELLAFQAAFKAIPGKLDEFEEKKLDPEILVAEDDADFEAKLAQGLSAHEATIKDTKKYFDGRLERVQKQIEALERNKPELKADIEVLKLTVKSLREISDNAIKDLTAQVEEQRTNKKLSESIKSAHSKTFVNGIETLEEELIKFNAPKKTEAKSTTDLIDQLRSYTVNPKATVLFNTRITEMQPILAELVTRPDIPAYLAAPLTALQTAVADITNTANIESKLKDFNTSEKLERLRQDIFDTSELKRRGLVENTKQLLDADKCNITSDDLKTDITTLSTSLQNPNATGIEVNNAQSALIKRLNTLCDISAEEICKELQYVYLFPSRVHNAWLTGILDNAALDAKIATLPDAVKTQLAALKAGALADDSKTAMLNAIPALNSVVTPDQKILNSQLNFASAQPHSPARTAALSDTLSKIEISRHAHSDILTDLKNAADANSEEEINTAIKRLHQANRSIAGLIDELHQTIVKPAAERDAALPSLIKNLLKAQGLDPALKPLLETLETALQNDQPVVPRILELIPVLNTKHLKHMDKMAHAKPQLEFLLNQEEYTPAWEAAVASLSTIILDDFINPQDPNTNIAPPKYFTALQAFNAAFSLPTTTEAEKKHRKEAISSAIRGLKLAHSNQKHYALTKADGSITFSNDFYHTDSRLKAYRELIDLLLAKIVNTKFAEFSKAERDALDITKVTVTDLQNKLNAYLLTLDFMTSQGLTIDQEEEKRKVVNEYLNALDDIQREIKNIQNRTVTHIANFSDHTEIVSKDEADNKLGEFKTVAENGIGGLKTASHLDNNPPPALKNEEVKVNYSDLPLSNKEKTRVYSKQEITGENKAKVTAFYSNEKDLKKLTDAGWLKWAIEIVENYRAMSSAPMEIFGERMPEKLRKNIVGFCQHMGYECIDPKGIKADVDDIRKLLITQEVHQFFKNFTAIDAKRITMGKDAIEEAAAYAGVSYRPGSTPSGS